MDDKEKFKLEFELNQATSDLEDTLKHADVLFKNLSSCNITDDLIKSVAYFADRWDFDSLVLTDPLFDELKEYWYQEAKESHAYDLAEDLP